jgi:FkbM family methyltransferase
MISQFGQDHLVLELLGGLRGGFFLDTGAADGITVSNTLLLEKEFGWGGVCVEPDDRFFEALVRNRQCQCVHCCLHDREGSVDFLEAGTLGGIFDDYHPRLLAHAVDAYRLPLDEEGRPRTVQKHTRTLRSLLRMAGAPRVIDYWSLDTEGSELKLLQSFPFDEHVFNVLTVEHNHMPVRAEIRAFLAQRGYEFVCEIGVDDCYIAARVEPGAWRSQVWRRRSAGA